MKKILSISTVVFVLIGLSCKNPSATEKRAQYLTGNWKTMYYKWELPTFKNRDTLVEYDVDFSNPGEERASRTSFYTYYPNGTFESWERNKNGANSPKTRAKWSVSEDSLYHAYTQGKKTITISFSLELIEDGFAIKALFDQDRDGEKDDVYYMETLRLPDNFNN
jgi:hypothetical protein